MGAVSDKYAAAEVTVGTAKYKLSAPLNTIYNKNDELDLSIAQTAWNKQQYFAISPRNSATDAQNQRVPTAGVTSFTPTLQYHATSKPSDANFFNIAYRPSPGTEQITMYPCIVSGNANCYIGTQYISELTPYTTTSDIKVFTEFKYGEILFIARQINGWKKSEFSFDNMYSSGNILTTETIPWEDFITAPGDYYVVGDSMPIDAYIWNGSRYVPSSRDTINIIRPCYMINSKFLKSFNTHSFMPSGCGFRFNHFKAGALPSVPQISVNQYRDGLSTRMPWGLTTTNSVAGSVFNYSFIDYKEFKTEFDFDSVPAAGEIPSGTHDYNYFDPVIIETDQFKMRITNTIRGSKTADNRYGYTSAQSEADIVYDGKIVNDLLAGLGMYFVDTADSSDLSGYTPDTIKNSEHAYLGEMDDGGYTTCRFIFGDALKDYEGYNANGDNVNPGFDPGREPQRDNKDKIDDMALGYTGYANGFVNYYQITSGQLEKVSQAISSDTEHLNLINSVVSLKSYAINTNAYIGSSKADTVKINGVDTQASANRIVVTEGAYHIGSVQVLGQYGTSYKPHFLDFAPYTSIEVYIPYCGTIPLPDKVMYHSIDVYIVADIFSGACKGVVKMDGDIVAEKAGMIGYDVPLTAQATAQMAAALKQAVLTGVAQSAKATVAIATKNVPGAVGSVASGLSNVSQSNYASNDNYTRQVGATTDRMEYAMPAYCFLKIYSPDAVVPPNYERTFGRPCAKTKRLGDCSGLTICGRVDISGISATAREKEIILRTLQNGVRI